jgi:hypothetical protein
MSVVWSIVLPSRERPDVLETLLQSLQATTADLGAIECLVAFDKDDKSTADRVHEFTCRFLFTEFVPCDRQDNLSEGYYNRLARMAKGRFIQVMNDDCRFLTPQWDSLAIPAMEAYAAQFPDRVAYGKCDDGLGTGYACFPTLTREAVESLGWFFHPEFRTWAADIHLHAVFAGVDRCVALPFALAHDRRYDALHWRLGSLQTVNMGSISGCVWNLQRFIDEGVPCWT